MEEKPILKDKLVLVVDDEPDVLDSVSEELDMCLVHKAKDYDKACEYLIRYTYDVVVLDIMGVNGFELLKKSVEKGCPTVMFTAHVVTPEAIKKSMELGAVFFLPKDEIRQLKGFLEDVVLEGGKPMWKKFFDQFGSTLNKRFGPDWKEKEDFFKDFEEELRR
jgi:DNA-binding NtrC family response regulator